MSNLALLLNIIFAVIGIVASYPIFRNLGRIIGYYINGELVGEPVTVNSSAKEPLVRQLRMARGQK